MIETLQGQLRFSDAPFDHRLVLSWRSDGRWKPLTLRTEGDAYLATEGSVRARLTIRPAAGALGYTLSFTSTQPTRLQLAVTLPPGGEDPFHLIPSFLFGDNNLAHVGPNHVPNLTRQTGESPSLSPYWECRADRASHPASLMVWSGGLAAVSILPYSDGRPRVGPADDETFIRNGVFAQLNGDDRLSACGVTLGYGNLPVTYVGPQRFPASSAHFNLGAEAGGRIFLRRADDRRAAHAVIRELYEEHREKPEPPISRERAARDLTRAFLDINWHGDDGRNAIGTDSGVATPWFGGKRFRNNFTNMRCTDEPKVELKAWRTLAEVGWSGGAAIAYPLLRAGAMLGESLASQRAIGVLDSVADGLNPESGFLFDVSGKEEGKRLNWWWSAPPVMDCHCAYTNASAVYYLLKAHRYATSNGVAAAGVERWKQTALAVCDAVLRVQMHDGGLGYTYHATGAMAGQILDPDGFAGAWFVPGLAMAYGLTREAKYLDAATRALARYHQDVKRLSCWGTPMDVPKYVDHEGNLGFLRGALMLREVTGSDEFLEAAIDSAVYEYLWRYGQRTRPQFRPLRGSPFNSCGGSITSSGTSMHPMGVYLGSELAELARLTGDGYHQQRSDDGLDWAANTVALWPDFTGYGARGVMTERYCPSDGTAFETWPDGSPSSIWFSYNGWAAAASLEGLVESL